jgi:hypothetical protein
MSQAASDKIKELNIEFRVITGQDAYLYAYNPGDGRGWRYVFVTSATSIKGSGAALAHMTEVLEKARSGWTVEEIIYGKERTENAR